MRKATVVGVLEEGLLFMYSQARAKRAMHATVLALGHILHVSYTSNSLGSTVLVTGEVGVRKV